ncbi:restriction endonuclease [Methylomonas lenta]|uniref:Restriction endonuclease n=1 Tax=Methylomonas lenta TaxID=980561 RepID=A0A177MWU3_9GAMM|nr:restriction endonuclease [Methylomonas lenta]OAI09359.1 restriction endonuclease [Methylomonas lenta]
MPGLFSSIKQLFSETSNQSPPQPVASPRVESKAEKAVRHRVDALAFVEQKHREAHYQQRKQDEWHRRYGKQKAAELNQLSGTEFEIFLAGLFSSHGYQVELTPTTGDYGADLLLFKSGQRIAVQAKCYTGSVGVSAVQEALAGMAYYQCHAAWVVTTGNFTTNAVELGYRSNVQLVDSTELGKLIKQLENQG